MKDIRCLVGVHKWVGKRRQGDQQTESLWDVADDDGFVVWCKRCGKDRGEGLAWMGGAAVASASPARSLPPERNRR